MKDIYLELNEAGNNVIIKLEVPEDKFIGNYASLTFKYNKCFYSGVIDYEGNIAVPFRKAKDINKLFSTLIYEKDKAIYTADGKMFFAIDLTNTNFIKQNGICIPENPLNVFDGYINVLENKIVAHNEKGFFLYNVSQNKTLSNYYDFISYYNGMLTGELYCIDESNDLLALINCYMDLDGNLSNYVTLDGVTVWYHDEVIKDTDLLRQEGSNTLRKLHKDSKLCSKIVQ